MTSVWSYPWRLLSDRGRSLADLRDHGIDGVAVASHYHSIRALHPTETEDPFVAYPGGCFFNPGDHFDDEPIQPQLNEVEGYSDPLAELTGQDAAADLSITAWMVCLHNTQLGKTHPTFRVESAFGHAHDHAFCPSHPAVRSYYGSVAESLAATDVDTIGLESIGFPSAFHGHGDGFGHEKHQVVNSSREEVLLSQCFCDACCDAADFDVEAARTVVRALCETALSTPADTVPSLPAVVDDHPILADLFEFRARVVESLVSRIDRGSGDVSVTYYAADGLGRGPTDGWPAGVDLERLSPYIDRVTALCYTGDPAVARERVAAFNERVTVPVDAGVSFDPAYVETPEDWEELVDAVRENLDGKLLMYNESLLTDEQLDWVVTASDRDR